MTLGATPERMDTAENDAPTDDEVMMYFGRAVFQAQRFEFLLCTAVMMLTVQKGDRTPFLGDDGNADEAKVVEFLDKLERLTLGQLKGELEKLRLLNEEAIGHVVSLNQTRKRLVHHFFAENDEQFKSPEGRLKVVKELDQTRTDFETSSNVLHRVLSAELVRTKSGGRQGQ